MQSDVLLSIRNVSKRFGGTQALDDVSFDVCKGEIHALLGENGAGKSTLMKIVSGVVQKDRGCVFLEGQELKFRNAHQAREAGINTVHQELSLIPELSVAENIIASGTNMNSIKLMRYTDLGENVMSIIDMLGIDLRTPVKALGISSQQMVEIAGAISRKCRVLILDEPTASLTNEETQALYRIMRMLKSAGVMIVFISHKLSEVFDIADRATIMKDGRIVQTADVKDLDENTIIKLMTGRDLKEMYPQKTGAIGTEVLRVENLSGNGFESISMELHAGEILGLAGLTGSGRTEFCTAIFGARSIIGGRMTLDGRQYSPRNVKEAMDMGIGYLPEDRKQSAIFLQMNIQENSVAGTIDRYSPRGFLERKAVQTATTGMIRDLNTKIGSIRDRISSLSGGNQQKVVLGRWLLASPKVLIVDEPTRGIDVGAKYEIYRILRSLADKGMAIILVSSELPEILGLCDRVLAFYKGSVNLSIQCDDPNFESKVGSSIMGCLHADMCEESGNE